MPGLENKLFKHKPISYIKFLQLGSAIKGTVLRSPSSLWQPVTGTDWARAVRAFTDLNLWALGSHYGESQLLPQPNPLPPHTTIRREILSAD